MVVAAIHSFQLLQMSYASAVEISQIIFGTGAEFELANVPKHYPCLGVSTGLCIEEGKGGYDRLQVVPTQQVSVSFVNVKYQAGNKVIIRFTQASLCLLEGYSILEFGRLVLGPVEGVQIIRVIHYQIFG